MEIQALVDVLKKIKEEKIITDLSYRVLDPSIDEDLNTLNLVTMFDEEGLCFGDYDVLDSCSKYLNLAIFLEDELIGYLGYCYDYGNENIFSICMCLNKKYQGIGIGKIILSQVINTIFTCYDVSKVVADIVVQNKRSWHLVTHFGFKRKNFDTYLFPSNGLIYMQGEVEYTRDDYIKNENKLVRYRKLNIKNDERVDIHE